MKQKRHSTEEIIRILREADSGKDLEAVCRQHHIATASFYRWKKKYGGMELKDAQKGGTATRDAAPAEPGAAPSNCTNASW